MVELCTECPNRPLCSVLCPEAELYANQDWTYRKEITIPNPVFSKEWPEASNRLFTKTETSVVNLLLDGRTRKEISELLGITRITLRRHIGNIKKKRSQIH